MGGDDHLDDNELGNLPPEAFNPWDVEGPFDPQDHWLRNAERDHQMIAVRAWFLDRFCDPAQNTTRQSKVEGYQFVQGGPYDPADVLPDRFASVVDEDVLQEAIDEFRRTVGNEWAPIQPGDSQYDENYGVVVEDSAQPLARLSERLKQANEVLALQGYYSAQLLARNLAFASTITSLESFLWETITYWVDHDEATVFNITTKLPLFRDQPLRLGQIFERRETLKDDIKAYLQNMVWHQWGKVAPLFVLGLGVEVPSFDQLDDALKKRHDIVHRSGTTKAGEPIAVTSAEIEALSERILHFATELNNRIAKRGHKA